jgi:hypothetical protein
VALLLGGSLHSARALALARLTVLSFTLAADADRPQVDVPFHLIVTLRVRERVSGIDNLELPILAELELLGDERSVRVARGGTLYRETISVVARRAGEITIGPAVLQAVDPRDNHAKQYATNGLVLHVVEPPGAAIGDSARAASAIAGSLVRVMLWIVGFACLIGLVVLIFRRRPVPVPVPIAPPVEASPPPTLARSPRDRLRDAYTVLQAERTRATAVRIRGVVWQMVGASEGETLADVLHRPQAADPSTRDLLRALERAAFTYDDDLPAAIDHACHMFERCLQI